MRKVAFYIIVGTLFTLFFLQGKKVQSLSAGNLLNDTIASIPWYTELLREEGIAPSAFYFAYKGLERLKVDQLILNDSLITLIDFSKPSNEERFFIIDIKNGNLVQKSLVAHGKNSGLVFAEDFSNIRHSNKSSLGLFVTSNTYQGKHGYSLRIDGQDEELNSNARERAVVIHGANYVSQEFIKQNGRIGRSFGCPALPYSHSSGIIDLIKEGSCLFIYHPSLSSTSQYQPGKVN